MGPFLAALKLLTILPVAGAHHLSDDDWGRATAWYPAVGLVLGSFSLGWLWGCAGFSPLVWQQPCCWWVGWLSLEPYTWTALWTAAMLC